MKKSFVISAIIVFPIVLIAIFSAACAPDSIAAATAVPTPEPAPALSPTPSPTQIPTPTPSPSPTPEPLLSAERKAELNLQITDFINNQGDFTKHKKSKMAIGSETTEELGSTELGLADSQPKLEGYLFDYVEKDGSLILLMGFDGKDGKGFITPIQIPLYLIEGSKTNFYFLKSDYNTVLSPSSVAGMATDENAQKIFEYLDKLEKRVIAIIPSFEKYPGSSEGYTGVVADYFIEHNSKVGLASKLISLVATNEIKIRNENYHEGDYDDYEIIKFENVDSIDNLDLSKIPLIDPIIIFYE